MRFFSLIAAVSILTACASSGARAPEPLTDVKYFQVKPYEPEPGVLYARLTARVEGQLNIKNKCLLIGKHVPVFAKDLLIARDGSGLFVQHEKGGRKYRLGDNISGGGGYSSNFRAKAEFVDFKNGASPDICKPKTYRLFGREEVGAYVSFWMSEPD